MKIPKGKPTLIGLGGEPISTMSPAQLECCKLLADMLNDAEAGNITSLVVVACGPDSFGSAMAGSDAARMVLGLESAKFTIIKRATGG